METSMHKRESQILEQIRDAIFSLLGSDAHLQSLRRLWRNARPTRGPEIDSALHEVVSDYLRSTGIGPRIRRLLQAVFSDDFPDRPEPLALGPQGLGALPLTQTTIADSVLRDWLIEFFTGISQDPQGRLERIRRFIDSETVEVESFAPLYGCLPVDDAIPFPPLSLEIVPVPDWLYKSLTYPSRLPFPGGHAGLKATEHMPAVRSVIDVPRLMTDSAAPDAAWKVYDRQDESLRALITALRLSGNGGISSPGFFWTAQPWGGDVVSSRRLYDFPTSWSDPTVELDSRRVARTIEVLSILLSPSLQAREHFWAAIRNFNRVFTREAADDMVLDISIAMETLLLGGHLSDLRGEIRYRFCLWGSHLLEPWRPKERNADWKLLQLLYDVRSALAHGRGASRSSKRKRREGKRIRKAIRSPRQFSNLFRTAARNYAVMTELCAQRGEDFSLHGFVLGAHDWIRKQLRESFPLDPSN